MNAEELAFDGVCPVCDDAFTPPTTDEVSVGESYDAKVCVLPEEQWPDDETPQMLFHLKGDSQ